MGAMAPDTDLRDQLAADRTHLANERTLLAYVRTALALIAAGAGLLELLESFASDVAGVAFIAAGALLIPVGIWRFVRVRRDLRGR